MTHERQLRDTGRGLLPIRNDARLQQKVRTTGPVPIGRCIICVHVNNDLLIVLWPVFRVGQHRGNDIAEITATADEEVTLRFGFGRFQFRR